MRALPKPARRLLWFVLFWLVGVLSVGAVAVVIRAVLVGL
jgi:hypothetical protein